jgi:DNA replication initiation complex subunit (GINS family)
VRRRQMDELFEIADDHLRETSGMRAVDTTMLLRDYGNCQKLIRETRKRLKDLQVYIERDAEEGGFTASLARSLTDELRALGERAEDIFSDRMSKIDGQKSILQQIKVTRKTAQRELTHDLLTFIEIEFPTLNKKEMDVLVGATMAGAGFCSKTTLESDAGPVEPIPMKVSRAKRHHRQYYLDPGVERAYPSVIVRKKKQGQGKS